MLERFTPAARGAIEQAAREADAPNSRPRPVETEHLLLALLSEDAGIAYGVLHDAGLTAERVRADIERLTGSPSPAGILSEEDAAALRTIGIDVSAVLARVEESFGPGALDPEDGNIDRQAPKRGLLARRGRPNQGRSRFSERGRKVLELSLREAVRLHHDYIGPEHLLLGLIREGDGLAMRIVTEAGLSPAELRTTTINALSVAG